MPSSALCDVRKRFCAARFVVFSIPFCLVDDLNDVILALCSLHACLIAHHNPFCRFAVVRTRVLRALRMPVPRQKRQDPAGSASLFLTVLSAFIPDSLSWRAFIHMYGSRISGEFRDGSLCFHMFSSMGRTFPHWMCIPRASASSATSMSSKRHCVSACFTSFF